MTELLLLAETATVHHNRESIPSRGKRDSNLVDDKGAFLPRGTADPRNGIPPSAAAQGDQCDERWLTDTSRGCDIYHRPPMDRGLL